MNNGQLSTALDPPALLRPHPPVVAVGHPDERVHGVVYVVDHLLVQVGLGEDVEYGPRVAPPEVAEVVIDVEVDVLGPGPLGGNSIELGFSFEI